MSRLPVLPGAGRSGSYFKTHSNGRKATIFVASDISKGVKDLGAIDMLSHKGVNFRMLGELVQQTRICNSDLCLLKALDGHPLEVCQNLPKPLSQTACQGPLLSDQRRKCAPLWARLATLLKPRLPAGRCRLHLPTCSSLCFQCHFTTKRH